MKIAPIQKIFCLFVIICVQVVGFCQPAGFLSGTKLETKDGLSGLNVRKIIKDRYGFTWIATQDGLNRFDGVRFHKFTSGLSDTSKSTGGSDIYDLAIDSNADELYAATAYYGLNIISLSKNIIKKRVPLKYKSSSPTWVMSCASAGNYVFCGSSEGLVFRYNKRLSWQDATIKITEKFGSSVNGSVSQITIDGANRIWLYLNGAGILIVDTSLTQKIAFLPPREMNIESADGLRFLNVTTSRSHFIISTNKGIRCISMKTLQYVNVGELFPGMPVEIKSKRVIGNNDGQENFCFTDQSAVYLYSEAAGWSKFFISKDFDERNWLSLTYTLYIQNNSLFIGTQYGVLWVKSVYSPFTSFSISQGEGNTKIPHSTTLLSQNDSTLLACSTTDIFRVNLNTGNINKFNKPGFYFNIFSPEAGYVIASHDKPRTDLLSSNGTPYNLAMKYPALKNLQNTLLVSALHYHDSLIMIATEDPKTGIHIWNKQTGLIRNIDINTSPLSLRSNVINRLFLDSRNKVWIVCDDVVSIYDHENGIMNHLPLLNPTNKEALRINMDVCETKNNFWLATYGEGIVQLTKDYAIDTIYTYKDGMRNTGVYKIFAYQDSLVFVSSNNGISVLHTQSKKIYNYTQADGLMSDNFEETSGVQTKDAIFFGGEKGVVKIEPGKLDFSSTAPEVYFTDIEVFVNREVQNTFDLKSGYHEISKSYDRVTLHFTALGAAYPDKLFFQLRNRDKGNVWEDYGNQRFVELTLPPGTFRIEVRAKTENGKWGNARSITLRFLPKFHQTLGFKIAIGLLAFGLIYAFYRYRLNQIKKQQKIRKDISTDLHDDIGSTLNSVKVYTHLALEGKDKEQYIQMARQNLEQASIGLRDMIWVLDDKLDTADELLTRVKQFAIPLANALHIQADFKCDFEVQGKVFTKDEKRNLLLICKEAINNIIKYSGATIFSVHFAQENKNVKVIIADNGKGFDINTQASGNGLKNMQYRAKQIGYTCTITSTPGSGTQITLSPR